MRRALPAVLAAALAGCAVPPPACPGGLQPRVVDTLYFGLSKPGGEVAPAEWAAFVDQAVTPRFPDGLTSWPAAGQWRGSAGVVEREGSRVLVLVHEDRAEAEAGIAAIVQDYKRRFAQEAVLRTRAAACVGL